MLRFSGGALQQAEYEPWPLPTRPSPPSRPDQSGSRVSSAILAWLPPREREIATIIYARSVLSANDIRRFLARPLTNSAVRSMLTRLEAKGVIQKKREGKKFLYSPAIPDHVARERVLLQVSQDYFGGWLQEAALALLALVEKEKPDAIGNLGRHVLRAQRHRRAQGARILPA